MAVDSFLFSTFIGGIFLVLAYVAMAFTQRKKPTFDTAFGLLAAAAGIVAAAKLLWLLSFSENLQGLTATDKFYLFIGAVAAGWFGFKRILGAFGKLLEVELEDEDTGKTEQKDL